MVTIRKVDATEKHMINRVVEIHLDTFQGFFLTFMGRGFLKQLYRSYCDHAESGLLVALNDETELVGFLAYSGAMSDLYKYMIKKRLIPFAWYAVGAFFRRPTVFLRLVRAFLKPGEAKRNEPYVELASIGVSSNVKGNGIGSHLVDALKANVDMQKYAYINLETDAIDNHGANAFYKKNGFVLKRTFYTKEGRKMNEYRFGEKI